MHYWVKSMFVGTFLLIISLPVLNNYIGLIGDAPDLKGAFVSAKKPAIAYIQWKDGEYQHQYEAFFKDTLGFRNFLIRLRNQLDYSLFDLINSSDTRKTPDGTLQSLSELDYNLGKLRVLQSAIREDVEMIKFLQDTLACKNIHLCILFAPTKASYYSDKVPFLYDNTKRDTSDYEYYTQECRKNKINYLDLDSYFLQLKPIHGAKMYSRYGVHWTYYGAELVMDTLIRYIEAVKKINMQHFKMRELNPTMESQFTDHDLQDALNLLFGSVTDTLYYPSIEYSDTIGKAKPNVLVISDSYQYPIHFTGIPQRVYNDYGFWYYYKTYNNKTTEVRKTHQVDLRKEVESKDVIFLMATKANLGGLGWGFIRDLYNLYTGKGNSLADIYENRIKRNAPWLQSVKQKAEKFNIPFLKMIRMDGEYMAAKDIEKYSALIRQSDTWLADIKQKAVANNIPLEQMISRDAEYAAIQNSNQ